jgi:hypothetical protein
MPFSRGSLGCSLRSGPLQDRGHDREVARCNHTRTPVAGETVELGIVAGTEPARADNHMHPPLHVFLDCGGADVVDEDIDLRGLLRGHPSL